jgi:hypothetical protein
VICPSGSASSCGGDGPKSLCHRADLSLSEFNSCLSVLVPARAQANGIQIGLKIDREANSGPGRNAAIPENQLFTHFFPKSWNNDAAPLLRCLNWSDGQG